MKMLKLKPEKFAALPVLQTHWVPPKSMFEVGRAQCDVWLSARERERKGLVWIYECPHGRWLLIGARATVHGPWKARWNQGCIQFPSEHRHCPHKIYTQGQWQLSVKDHLSYFTPSVPIRYRGFKWYTGDIDVRLYAEHGRFTAVLDIAAGPSRRVAHVTYVFPHLRDITHINWAWLFTFHLDFQVAWQKFLDLLQHLTPDPPAEEWVYATYVDPQRLVQAARQILGQ